MGVCYLFFPTLLGDQGHVWSTPESEDQGSHLSCPLAETSHLTVPPLVFLRLPVWFCSSSASAVGISLSVSTCNPVSQWTFFCVSSILAAFESSVLPPSILDSCPLEVPRLKTEWACVVGGQYNLLASSLLHSAHQQNILFFHPSSELYLGYRWGEESL